MADALADAWYWIADRFEARPWVALLVFAVFAAAVAGCVVVVGV